MAPSRKGKEKLNEDKERDEKVIEAAETLVLMRRKKNFDREGLRKAMKGRNLDDKLEEKPLTQEAPVSRSSELTRINVTNLPRLPPIGNLQGIIGICSDPFKKKLTKTDLFDGQGKLSLLKYDVEKALLPLLNQKEIDDLANIGIQVYTYDDSGDRYPMTFKNHFESYKLFQGWTEFLSDRGLNENDEYYVVVWMFRRKDQNGKLCFAVIVGRKE